MAVSIRLRRMGRKKQPHYRIVVAESEHPRDGRFVESLGFYKPLSAPARLVVDLERVDYWIGKGAQPSGTVQSLIKKARKGGDASVVVGAEDVEAEKTKRAEMLAERRAKEKRAEAKGAAADVTVVPQDVADVPGGSSSEDRTAAEAVAVGEEEAVARAEDTEPNDPPEQSIKKSSAADKATKGRAAGVTDDVEAASRPKAGASGEEDGAPEGVATPTEVETPALEPSGEAKPAKKAKKAKKDEGAGEP